MRGKTNLTRPLKPLNHQPPPLHDMIISSYVKHSPQNLHKKVCDHMQSFFTKKVSLYLAEGRGDTALSAYLLPFIKMRP